MRGLRSSPLLPHPDSARAPTGLPDALLRMHRMLDDVHRPLQIHPERAIRRRHLRLVALRRLMPGTGCCSLPDTVRLTAHAVKLGCAGVLMLPPFYYKGVSDEGLYRSFSETIERVGDRRLRIYLYHIPPVAQVGISPD